MDVRRQECGAHAQAGLAELTCERRRLEQARTRVGGKALLPVDVRKREQRAAAEIGPAQPLRAFGHREQLLAGEPELAEERRDARPAQPQLERLLLLVRAEQLERASVESLGLSVALAALGFLGGAHERSHGVRHRRRHVRSRHLAGQQARLLEVVGDDLDEVLAHRAQRGDPLGEAHVQARAASLR